MIRDGASPVAAARVDHACVLSAVHACTGDVGVDDLPDDPCGRIQSVHVGIDARGEPEGRAHLAGVSAGRGASVNLAHPEVLAGGKREVTQFGASGAAVGVRVDAGDRGLGVAGELVECVDLRVYRGLV